MAIKRSTEWMKTLFYGLLVVVGVFHVWLKVNYDTFDSCRALVKEKMYRAGEEIQADGNGIAVAMWMNMRAAAEDDLTMKIHREGGHQANCSVYVMQLRRTGKIPRFQ